MRAFGFLLLGTLFIIPACGPAEDGGINWQDAAVVGDIDAPVVGDIDAYVPPPDESCSRMDIVFVIDDSGSMSEEQSNLAANFPVFAQVLQDYQTSAGQPLDFRVAITTTGRDVDYTLTLPGFPPIPFSESGYNGAFVQRGECGMTRRWFERGDANFVNNFSCAAQVGTGGPGIEMPLLTTDWALNERVDDGTNAGFLRDDALLAIVILSDEDDCSRADNNFDMGITSDACDVNSGQIVSIPTYLSTFDSVKDNDRERWAAAVIAGQTSCSTPLGDAVEATRLKDFVAQTGANGVFSSICQGDLASPLQEALATFDAACQAFPPIE